ncbi:MAG: GNAT family N-acetyltransferase [Ginsengibacter sp.]
MNFELQPTLECDLFIARPLTQEDFESLFMAASDPLVWDQHPNKNRYQRDEFSNFFKGAIESGGALVVIDKASNEIIGSSRFYDLNETDHSVFIGYTFFSRKYWGKEYNRKLKSLMLRHAFKFVEKVLLHVGAENYRSQKSITKVGAIKTSELEVQYFGEASRMNFEYEIAKASFLKDAADHC